MNFDKNRNVFKSQQFNFNMVEYLFISSVKDAYEIGKGNIIVLEKGKKGKMKNWCILKDKYKLFDSIKSQINIIENSLDLTPEDIVLNDINRLINSFYFEVINLNNKTVIIEDISDNVRNFTFNRLKNSQKLRKFYLKVLRR